MDVYHLLRKLTIRKIWNFLLLSISYFLSTVLKKHFLWGHPATLSIEPSSYCNLSCPECPAGVKSLTREKGFIDIELFDKILEETYPYLIYLNLYFQGEPFLHNRFIDMIKRAVEKKVYTSTSTNGHFLTPENIKGMIESGLDRLIISVDGTTQEVYEKYRVGGDMETVISGIKNVVEWKKKFQTSKPFLILSFLALSTNEHQINDIKELGKKLGVDKVVIKTAQVKDMSCRNDLVPAGKELTRYKFVDGHYELKKKLTNRCWRAWSSPVITFNGKLVPCCFDKNAEHSLGEVVTTGFRDVWKGNGFKDFRERILNERKTINICRNCTSGQTIFVRKNS
ncbi:MAG: SPASM domain-containing protein [Bacteroidetes bacterium]|nr:SPASM domain-containing protein [Bacteroidota bacterium]